MAKYLQLYTATRLYMTVMYKLSMCQSVSSAARERFFHWVGRIMADIIIMA